MRAWRGGPRACPPPWRERAAMRAAQSLPPGAALRPLWDTRVLRLPSCDWLRARCRTAEGGSFALYPGIS